MHNQRDYSERCKAVIGLGPCLPEISGSKKSAGTCPDKDNAPCFLRDRVEGGICESAVGWCPGVAAVRGSKHTLAICARKNQAAAEARKNRHVIGGQTV